jgi:Colicin V production protein
MSADELKLTYYGASALIIGLLGLNGWRQGFARQAMTLVSIVCAYAAAYFGAGSAAPAFRFLGYPPQITTVIAGGVIGLCTFLGLHGLRRILFKRTAQQPSTKVRLSYGILGALIGMAFGAFLFVVTTGVVRALGFVAKSRLEDMEKEARESPTGAPMPPLTPEDDPGAMVRSIAKLGTALDQGKSGDFFHRYEKAPAAHVFSTLTKLGIMISRPEAVDRFLKFPGVGQLTGHPKLVAVKNDPEVAALLASNSYIKLLRHEKVLALSADEEFNALIKKMNFEKALDHALQGVESAKAPPDPAGKPPGI